MLWKRQTWASTERQALPCGASAPGAVSTARRERRSGRDRVVGRECSGRRERAFSLVFTKLDHVTD